MRLTARFLLAFVATMAIALGVTAWLNLGRERDLFDRDLRSDSLLVARLVAHTHDLAMQAGDAPGAAAAIASANQIHAGIAVEVVAQAQAPAALRAALAAGRPGAIRDDVAGRLDTYVPLKVASRPAAIHVAAGLDAERRYVHGTKRRAAIASLAALLAAAAVVSALGLALIARPTRALIAKTQRVAAGDFTAPLALRQKDELGDLAGAINEMTDDLARAQARATREAEARVAAVEQLRHADRLMTVGRLSAGIAHELGTPLNVIEGRAKMIREGEVEGDEIVDSARIIGEQSRRITTIVRQLLDFARRGAPDRGDVDLVATATQAERLLAATAKKAQVALIAPAPRAPLVVRGDAGQLVQVVTNLVVNAIHATPPHGQVALAVDEVVAAPPRPGAGSSRCARLTVTDTGAGIPPEVRDRIFEPFFTTKDVGQGTGLGLSVVHGIVEDHGGWVEVDSTPGAGSAFSVYLPMP